jgi:SAM-dependent methyltransferase
MADNISRSRAVARGREEARPLGTGLSVLNGPHRARTGRQVIAKGDLRRGAARLWLRGSGVTCPCCGREYRRFMRADGVENSRCPGCGSYPRHRLLWLWLEGRLQVRGDEPLRVLHFAPEPGISGRLRNLPGVEYLSGDLDPAVGMRQMDVSDLPFADDSWDLILCNHVITYVEDDRRALAELARVLAPGGLLVMQNPIDVTASEKYDAADAYGLRRYGRDLPGLIREAGLEVRVHEYREELDERTRARFGIHAGSRRPHVRGDDIYACSHSGAG